MRSRKIGKMSNQHDLETVVDQLFAESDARYFAFMSVLLDEVQMEPMTTEGYNDSADARLLEAKHRLADAAVELDWANREYLLAIASHIAICAEIRGISEE